MVEKELILIATLIGWLSNQISWQFMPKVSANNPFWWVRQIKPFRCYYCMSFWLGLSASTYWAIDSNDLESSFWLLIFSMVISRIWFKLFKDG